MIEGYSPLAQTVIGTALTWGATALGAFFCIFQRNKRSQVDKTVFLDGSLGFSAGVMLAASFWSLLQPGLELSRKMESSNAAESWHYLPVTIGFIAGTLFILTADYFFPEFDPICDRGVPKSPISAHIPLVDSRIRTISKSVRFRGSDFEGIPTVFRPELPTRLPRISNRLWLFLLAITVHNIPEGLAVGVAFGAENGIADRSAFVRARNLALGMSLQNFPEGLAVALPLRAAGYSFWQSFWYGQLSGFVEPVAGILGCITVQYIYRLQPYALGFAAGAMIFVILDDVIPEAHHRGNGRLASILACLGFVVMMILDVQFAV